MSAQVHGAQHFDKEKRKALHFNEDAMIAATAINHHLTVVTRNIDDFGDIEGLDIVDWSR